MSWSNYLDSIKQKCDGLVALGIWGDNGVPWAQEGAQLAAAEVALIANCFTDDTVILNKGFTIAGNRFVATKIDKEDFTMIGKGRKEGNAWSTGPVTVMKIKGAIVFAVGNSEVQGGQVNLAVAHIAEFLRDAGFMP